MMMNLFSMFDPATSVKTSFNWFSLLWLLFFFPKNFFKNNIRIKWLKDKIFKYILVNLMASLNISKLKIILMITSYFFLIWLMNMLSIMPFIFTPTSHISISLYFSMPFWLNLMIKGWTMSPLNMLAHLVPLSTPLPLCPFMVIIETVSNLIRPLTLCVRLSANLIAGHILMTLLSQLLNFNLYIFFSTSVVLNALLVLEFSVTIIQGYVFITLLSLYLNEI